MLMGASTLTMSPDSAAVIAHLHVGKSTRGAIVSVAILGFAIVAGTTFWEFLIANLQRGDRRIYVVVGAFFACLPEWRKQYFVLSQIWRGTQSAIWVTGDKVVFLSKNYLSVDRTNIARIELTYWSLIVRTDTYLTLHTRNGSKKNIPMIAMTESPDAIIAHLAELLDAEKITST